MEKSAVSVDLSKEPNLAIGVLGNLLLKTAQRLQVKHSRSIYSWGMLDYVAWQTGVTTQRSEMVPLVWIEMVIWIAVIVAQEFVP